MATSGDGRKRGRPVSDLEREHLGLLLEVRARAHHWASSYDERLEDFVLSMREDGATVRGIAEAIEVGPSTVQTWTLNARRRRSG